MQDKEKNLDVDALWLLISAGILNRVNGPIIAGTSVHNVMQENSQKDAPLLFMHKTDFDILLNTIFGLQRKILVSLKNADLSARHPAKSLASQVGFLNHIALIQFLPGPLDNDLTLLQDIAMGSNP